MLEELREELTQVPGVVIAVEQPLSHLISHMLSGVKAQVGIKLYGDDLGELRRTADRMKAAIAGVPGVKDLMVEQQEPAAKPAARSFPAPPRAGDGFEASFPGPSRPACPAIPVDYTVFGSTRSFLGSWTQ